MTRSRYKSLLLNKGFRFEKSTLSYPRWRGDEDVYTHKPDFKYTFRVFRLYRNKPYFGLYVGVGDQFKLLDSIVKHDIDLPHGVDSNRVLPVWTYDSAVKLIGKLNFSTDDNNQKWTKEDDEELITVILPIIRND